MKKLALLSLLITIGFTSIGQSPRLVMLEHFTQASCGPCASVNPTIHNILVNNPQTLTCINYHTSWPGYDPMYLHNTVDPTSRVTYYGVNSVPHSVIDGNVYSGHPNGWTGNMTMINNRAAVPSPFTLSVNQHLSTGNDTLFVTMLVEATMPVTGPITAYMGVIEKLIHFTSAPGSNGEKDFYNVLKKMLPTKSGIALPTPMQTGDYVILESYWVLANVYQLDQLSVVSFIQNPTTKEVHQAANLQLTPIEAVYDNDVESVSLTNMLQRYCTNTLAPNIRIRNNGNNNLTNLSIKYQVNNEEIHTFQWNGNMAFLGKAELELPDITFTMQDTNTLKVYVDQVNQVNDEYTKNDTLVHTFYPSYKVGQNVQLKVRTDNGPGEVTWAIINSAGETVASGGPYTESGTMYTEDILLEEDDCYDFFIYDSGGNGLCCGNGAGFFRLAPPSGSPVLAQGTSFGYELSAQFEVYTVGVNNIANPADLKVYPNPAGNKFMIEVPASIAAYSLSVANQMGQRVYEAEGLTGNVEINSQKWTNGLYIITIESEQGVLVRKMNILK